MARRHLIETYLACNGAQMERRIELDAMRGTLDFLAHSAWVRILPA